MLTWSSVILLMCTHSWQSLNPLILLIQCILLLARYWDRLGISLSVPVICVETDHCPDLLCSHWGHQTQLVLTQKWKVPLCASSCASLLQFLALFVFTCKRKQICSQCQLSGFLVWCRWVWRGSAVFCKFVTVQIRWMMASDGACQRPTWSLTKVKGCSQRDRKLGNGLLNCDVYICLHLGCEPIMMISDRKQMQYASSVPWVPSLCKSHHRMSLGLGGKKREEIPIRCSVWSLNWKHLWT